MNFLIFASPLGRAKIMRIHTHEWNLITLIFENEWYSDVIPRYKENKQQTTTNKQPVQTITLVQSIIPVTSNNYYHWLQQPTKRRRSSFSIVSILIFHFLTLQSDWWIAIEEQKLTINTPSAGGVSTNNNRVRRLEIDGIIPSPRNYCKWYNWKIQLKCRKKNS